MISINNFNTAVLIWISIALAIFPIQLFITVPYGRHSKRSWGLMINNNVGWIIMEIPALLVFVWTVLNSKEWNNPIVIIAFSLWIIHYFHRSIIYPFRIKTKNKKMPVLITSFAFIFNLINGFINGYWLANFASYSLNYIYDFRFIFGFVLFVSGFVINKYHDRILIGLRKNTSNGYQIPFGGLFNYISCPNFLGEIIEWAGFAILVWSLPSLAFFIWTFINLVPRAIDHHKWYKKQFAEYPKNRKALIPYIF